MAVLIARRMPMNSTDEQFFKALGSRIAQARKAHCLTQQQVADKLGIPQQTYANYEVAYARIHASMLPVLGQMLGLSPEELLGHDPKPTFKRGPVSRLDQQIERIRKLPRVEQQVLMEMLDGILAQAGN
jgi:transcriptional regulator with XRE-family HTH domain